MFWIGFAVGTGICAVAVVVGLSAIAWASGKEREFSKRLNEKYWNDSLEVQNRNAATFERIEDILKFGKG